MTEVIIYLPGQSQYTPRVDQFRRTGEELGRRLVWEGRPLSVEEFNKVFPSLIENARLKWSYEPIVEIIEKQPETPAGKVKKTKPVAAKEAAPKSAPESPKRSRGRPAKAKDQPVVEPLIPEKQPEAPAASPKKGPRFHILPV
jgi:hypothetical protein